MSDARAGEAPPPGRGETAAALVVFGVVAAVYLKTLGGPSLWLDEAWEASYYAGYTAAPWYNRPALYMAGVTALARVFGPSELVLRLLPCAAALAAVAATWAFARFGLGRVEGWIAAIALAIAPPFVSYAHQLKHYAFDALFAIVLTAAYLRYSRERTGGRLALWAALAIVSFGFSFSSIFVVAAIAVVEVFAARSAGVPLGRFVAVAVGIGGAFAASYFGFHAQGARDPLLTSYFAEAYAPLRDPLALPAWTARAAVRVAQDQTGIRSGIAAALLVIAGAASARSAAAGRLAIAVVALAGAAGMAASALSLYPFGVERLSLHFAPFLAILVAAAAGSLVREGPRRGARVLAAAALAYPLAFPAITGLRPYLVDGWRREHVRELVATIARDRLPGDGIFVNDDAAPAFDFYWHRLGHGGDVAGIVKAGRFRRDPSRHEEGVAAMAERYPRFWALLTHMPAEEMARLRALLRAACREERSVVEGDAHLGLYRCGEGT